MSGVLTLSDYFRKIPHGPLNGLVVADIGNQVCGPWAAEQLARKGAIVIKFEKPEEGDSKRRNSTKTAFNQFNAGKLSVQLDNSLQDRQKRLGILNACHVIIDNRSNEAKDRDDIVGYALTNRYWSNKQPLVYCSITGYGKDDPRKAYDRSLQAAVGMAALNQKLVSFPIIDMAAGTEAVKLILEQLFYIKSLDEGERLKEGYVRIDLSMTSVAMSLMSNVLATYIDTGKTESSIVPFGLFETKDGLLALATANDVHFNTLCNVLKLSYELGRYTTNELRLENRALIESRIADVLKEKPAAEWVRLMKEENIPAEHTRSFAEAFEEFGKHMIAHDSENNPYIRSPGNTNGQPVAPRLLPAPKAGEHNDLVPEIIEVLGERSMQEVRRLMKPRLLEMGCEFY